MSIKIYNDGVEDVKSTMYKNAVNKPDATNKPAQETPSEDKVELSSKALNLKQMQTKAMAAPDIREEKVDQIKLQLENGSYNISPESIAEKVIDEASINPEK